ncbi:arginine-tRNA protein transferase [Schizosaccharomyces japonicus yFS275]|uniref:Arginyl-tRNA--protein transferase 1 n=1 Tax=Schizosaccharomyces japonicus (strain yFS275 / FY16936) TaxID=402676 RepID=B6K0Y7_SCHJY|nr:arginine-tRNA protein transferase [Schizosaccharomyces japonicus yFS275]EEB07608.2 arginine-tRNA protein transferase [Schizosaccharomyces japonicus yFS275]
MVEHSVLSYAGYYYGKECGYCEEKNKNEQFGLFGNALTSEAYQILIDRGWRRSGKYLYKPNLRNSCCRMYTIRLDATQFKPSKEVKKSLKKWKRFLLGDKLYQKVYANKPFQLDDYIGSNALDKSLDDDKVIHKLTVELEPSSFSKRKFELYKKYQKAIHHDKEEELTEEGFVRFLCDSPLEEVCDSDIDEDELSDDENNHPLYGSFHQLYSVDDELVAVGVIDLLPHAVSSVYFFYDPDYKGYSLGKLSATYETVMAKRMGYQYYYMGYYIHTCQKMKYKGRYGPSYLLNPTTCTWLPLSKFVDCWENGAPRYIFFDEQGQMQTAAEMSRENVQKDDLMQSFKRKMPGIESEEAARKAIDDNPGGYAYGMLFPAKGLCTSLAKMEDVFMEVNATVGLELAKTYVLQL